MDPRPAARARGRVATRDAVRSLASRAFFPLVLPLTLLLELPGCSDDGGSTADTDDAAEDGGSTAGGPDGNLAGFDAFAGSPGDEKVAGC